MRTEPLLRNLRDEVVDSCEYAFQADHVSTHGGMTLESGAAPRGGGGGVLVLGATAAVLAGASPGPAMHRRPSEALDLALRPPFRRTSSLL